MFCPDCGKQLNDNAKFCSGCGKSLKEAAAIVEPIKPMTPPSVTPMPEPNSIEVDASEPNLTEPKVIEPETAKTEVLEPKVAEPEPIKPEKVNIIEEQDKQVKASQVQAPTPPVKKTEGRETSHNFDKPAEKKQAAQQKQIKQVAQPNVGRSIATVLFCIILSVLMLAASALLSLREVISEDGIENMVTNLDVSVVMDEIDVQAMLSDMVDEEILEEHNITPRTVRRFLEQDSVREFMSDQLYELVTAFIAGNETFSIPEAAVIDLIRDNTRLIENELGVSIREEDIRYIEDYLIDNRVLRDFPLQEIAPATSDDLENMVDISQYQWILRLGTLVFLLAGSVVMVVSIISVNLSRFRAALLGLGITFVTVGVIDTLFGFTAIFIISQFTDNNLIMLLVENAFSQARTMLLIIGGTLLVTGALLLVGSGLLRKFKTPDKVLAK